MEKVSIIVPIYNVEKYLKDCLDSLLNQTYENYEIILIDDGSTDSSGKICDDYKEENNNIIVIHQDNLGVAVAKNRGMQEATGEYILFVDADDYIESDTICVVVENIKSYDMVVFALEEDYPNNTIFRDIVEEPTELTNVQAIDYMFTSLNFGGYLCNKFFINKKIKENNLKINENIHMCEDMLFTEQYLSHCEKILVINKRLYHYRMRKTSAVWNKNDKFLTMFDAYKEIRKDLVEKNIDLSNFNYKLLSEFFKLSKHQRKTVREKVDIDINEIYKDTLKDKSISVNEKIKLKIFKNLNFIYVFYMKHKLKKLSQFE